MQDSRYRPRQDTLPELRRPRTDTECNTDGTESNGHPNTGPEYWWAEHSPGTGLLGRIPVDLRPLARYRPRRAGRGRPDELRRFRDQVTVTGLAGRADDPPGGHRPTDS